jgi:hypothetical protein
MTALPAKAWWKLAHMHPTVPTGDVLIIAECYLRQTAGGTNEIPIAVTPSSSAGGISSPAYIDDGDASTIFATASGDTTNASIIFQYSAHIAPVELFMQAWTSQANQTPDFGWLYYSDDGVTWTFAQRYALGAFTANGQSHTAALAAPPVYTTGHRYWKVGDLYSGQGYVSAGELWLQVGGADVIPPIAYVASSELDGGSLGSLAFDGTPASRWMTNGSQDGTSAIAFDYGTLIPPETVRLQAPTGDPPGRTAHTGNLYWSDDSIDGPWTLFNSLSWPADWGSGSEQFATVANPPPSLALKVASQAAFAAITSGPALNVVSQAAFAAMTQKSVDVAAQAAFAAMTQKTVNIASQSAFAVFMIAPPRRRQYYLQ